MKRLLISCLLAVMANMFATAQVVIWSDDFEGDKGWQTFEYKDKYSTEYTKKGQFLIKVEEDKYCAISSCRTNMNPTKNFTITVEAKPNSKLQEDVYFGLVFNYLDRNNYYYFCIEKGFAYFNEIKNGEVVRHDYDLIKNSQKDTYVLSIKKTGVNVMFLVNDEESLYIEDIEVRSSKVGLMVSGKLEVAFDNMSITQ